MEVREVKMARHARKLIHCHGCPVDRISIKIRSDEMMKDEDLLSISQSIVPVPVSGSVLLAILLVTSLPNHPKLALPERRCALERGTRCVCGCRAQR